MCQVFQGVAVISKCNRGLEGFCIFFRNKYSVVYSWVTVLVESFENLFEIENLKY